MGNDRIIMGKVISGTKEAAFFTQLDWVQDQFDEDFGFRPYPGTLNLEVSEEFLSVIDKLRELPGVPLISPDPAFCSAKAFPVKIGNIPGALLVPPQEINVHDSHVIEIMAPQKLKHVLDLQDGDLVSISVHESSPHKGLDVDAVIFDLDGTLIDSMDIHVESLNIALSRLGLNSVTREQAFEAAKEGAFEWGTILPENLPYPRDRFIAECQQIIEKVQPEILRKRLRMIEGTEQIIREISRSGLKLGLLTSTQKKYLEPKLTPLRKARLVRLFQVILTEDELSSRKPSPDSLLECVKRLGLSAVRAVYVGDSKVDIQAGKAAGMKTIGVLTGIDDQNVLSAERPDAVIPSVMDLRHLIPLGT